LPAPMANALRRLRGRPSLHNDPGSEWPHCGPGGDPDLLAAIRDFTRGS